MHMRIQKPLATVIASALLATGAVVATSETAAAADGCNLTGYMTAAGDYASLYEPNGPCYYAVLQANYHDRTNPGILYYNTTWARLRYPDWPNPGYIGSASMFSVTPPPTYYDIFRYRGCSNETTTCSSLSTWVTTFGNTGLP